MRKHLCADCQVGNPITPSDEWYHCYDCDSVWRLELRTVKVRASDFEKAWGPIHEENP